MPAKAGNSIGSLYIGLMSGTSMDGIDAVLVEFGSNTTKLRGHTFLAWDDQTRATLKQLALPGDNEIEILGVADIEVAKQFAQAVSQLLEQNGVDRKQIKAIGSHGQTIRHRPSARHPFTLQIGDPNQLAELTGITVTADFRRRDMAAGGQGAPLAPAFHAAILQDPSEDRVILNLGGIANITVLPANLQAGVIGFDTGPANTLMDAWITRCKQHTFDQDGAWAASGVIQPELLSSLFSESYFKQAAPKSTGPELFNLTWLEKQCPTIANYNPADIQATLCALSVQSITQAIKRHAPDCSRVICCGGGTRNGFFMRQLQQELGQITVEDTTNYGIAPEQIEATAFAWLASRTLERLHGNLPSVTGATHPVILGGIYQA
ncbi:MAG: anhydro-N-acetylmuramic acid kinase [Sedimenticola sp.]|nr:anhydro-N-acetylmuramic acid kinase [Sedimenticola sp.]